MASKNKKKKAKNARSYGDFALKEKKMKMKRSLFYNASKRKQLKKIDDSE